MVKLELKSSNYSFEANVGNSTVKLTFTDSFKNDLKFIKVDGDFKKTDTMLGNTISISNGSLVQMGYIDGGKLVITEPAWVEIANLGMGGATVNITHSI